MNNKKFLAFFLVSLCCSFVISTSFSQTITTVAGTGTAGFNGDGIPATSAQLFGPIDVDIDPAGNLYIADLFNHRVRRVDAATGDISTVAGTGVAGFNGDEIPATTAQLNRPEGVAVDLLGNLYIADRDNRRVRKVDMATGLITTVAGAGGFLGDFEDGIPATEAFLQNPTDVTFDQLGNLFIAEDVNRRIRRVDATTGIITTVAGVPGVGGFNGDGIPAINATLDFPQDIVIDGAGNLFIADLFNNRIRRVDAVTGIITTVAGTGIQGFNGDGIPATSAQLSFPNGVALDGSGTLFIGDAINERVRRVDAASGLITTVAGTGTGGFNGDNIQATTANLWFPAGVALDPAGNLYIADFGNSRVRKVTFPQGDVAITSAGNNLPLPNPNAPLQIFATVAKTGGVDIASVDVRIFLDVNSNLSFESGEPFVLITVTNLVVGSSQDTAAVFQCPPAGSYLGVAVADPGNLIAESNEGNNVGSTSLNVQLADLTATALTSTSSQMANGNYQVSLGATVANIGQALANIVQVRFAFSTNQGASFTNIGGPVNAGTITAGGTTTATKNWNNVAAGMYLIQVSADPNNLICEGVETNNVFQANISVGGLPNSPEGSWEIPTTYGLHQNYPNSFNPTTRISYNLPEAVHARLVVYDVLGREVKVLVDREIGAGHHVAVWDATDARGSQVPSGIYFYTLTAGSFKGTQRMILMR